MASAAGKDQGSACALCTLCTSESRLEVLSGVGTVAFRDDDLVALAVAGQAGALLVPCRHVKTLAELPGASGGILAGLKRAMRAVTATYEVAGATVEPSTEMPNASGHVAYWIIPTSGEGGAPWRADERAAQLVGALAGELRSLPPPEGWRVSSGQSADAAS